ncbi:hypothetical protein TI39_contig5829g00015 [Zymoseptoria brevis]|uniref:Uncharacterized protein n=1 Tax=Zymoseptoria brevis TaxID=1047168 RepID=A0A0F4G5Z7_9PEZI|nr:hypothetical protein TI39_contig5829g00015 [Zymoseptoria brevis]
MSSPNPLGTGMARHGAQGFDRDDAKYEKPLSPRRSTSAVAARSASTYSALQQHPGFHQFKIERPPPAAGARLVKTTRVVDDTRPYIDDSDALEVGMRGTSLTKHKSYTAQHAIAKMRRDQEVISAQESKLHHRPAASKPLSPAKKMKFETSPERRNARAGAKRSAVPELSATHPSHYARPLPVKAEHPMSSPRSSSKRSHYRPVHESQPELAVPPWQVYSDPKRLTSAVPMVDDPRFRMLKMDVRPDQPSVVSTLFMIALPSGTLIEGANRYEDDRV